MVDNGRTTTDHGYSTNEPKGSGELKIVSDLLPLTNNYFWPSWPYQELYHEVVFSS